MESTQKKYKLTDNTKNGLYQIQALIDIPKYGVRVGDLGGYIESERNLSHDGSAWVYGNAKVYDNAEVFGDAKVSGDAWVSGNAKVLGNAIVSGNAWVSGNTWLSGDAWVF